MISIQSKCIVHLTHNQKNEKKTFEYSTSTARINTLSLVEESIYHWLFSSQIQCVTAVLDELIKPNIKDLNH